MLKCIKKLYTLKMEVNNKNVVEEAKEIHDLVEKFDKFLDCSFFAYFQMSMILLAYINSCEVDSCDIRRKLAKHVKRFKYVCELFSKFRKLTKHSLVPKNTGGECKDFVYNYEKDKPLLAESELLSFVESLENNENTYNCVVSFKFNEDYKKLVDEINQLRIMYENKNNLDIAELKTNLEAVKEKLKTLKIRLYLDLIPDYSKALMRKHIKYSQIYLSGYIIKRQKPIEYKETASNTKQCAICLEDFENKMSVIKLKCGHIFCTECIKKWLKNSLTCPYCRKKLKLDIIERCFDYSLLIK